MNSTFLPNYIYTFVGASGTGKSTLLNYIKENYPTVKIEELGAREFLPKNGQSYDVSMTDSIQTCVSLNNLKQFAKAIIDKDSVVYSRSPIDVIAYSLVLNKGIQLIPLLEDWVTYIKDRVTFLYLPIEFDLTDSDDVLRGLNETVRKDTDKAILKELNKLNIPVTIISGTIEERQVQIDKIFSYSNNFYFEKKK